MTPRKTDNLSSFTNIPRAGVVEGISLGAQAGLTDEKEKAKAESLKLVTKTLVATYKVSSPFTL